MIGSPAARAGCLALLGAAVGFLLMFAGIVSSAEEGGDFRTWDELRRGKRLFGAGAAVALVAPILAYAIGRLRERVAARDRPTN